MKYKNVTQKVLFDNAILTSMMVEQKYDVITLNGDCSRESNVRILGSYFPRIS
jgi:hypothetical protein